MTVRFPDPNKAGGNGLLAIGGDLSPATLLAAYRQGIFPWFNRGDPIMWWSPDPRAILLPDAFHTSRRLARRIRQGRYRIAENTAFAEVMQGCADRSEGSWITPMMVTAYKRLHAMGHAASVEVWSGEELVGGLYGVQLGRAFFAESMFHRVTDASKMALAYLAKKAKREGWLFIDCQFLTPHLASLGVREVTRKDYLGLLDRAVR